MGALILQVLLLSAGIWVVMEREVKEEKETVPVMFSPRGPADRDRQQARSAEKARSQSRISQCLTVTQDLSDVAWDLPEMPSVDPVAANAGDTGWDRALKGGVAVDCDLDETLGAVEFLGVKDRVQRVMVAIDISSTVCRRMRECGWSMEKIRGETLRLLNQFEAATDFNIVQFSRLYDPFQPACIPATGGNRDLAADWLNNRLRTNGSGAGFQGRGHSGGASNGIQVILDWVFSQDVDAVFLLSDGNFYENRLGGGSGRTDLKALLPRIVLRQEERMKPMRIHFVGFGVSEKVRPLLRDLVEASGGEFLEY